MEKYQIVDTFRGYRTKTDKTKVSAGYLIEGSQNVLSTDGENIKIRTGYELWGAEDTSLTPVEASTTWRTKRGDELTLRAYDDELEVYFGSAWTRIEDGWSSVDFCFPEDGSEAIGWWDDTEKQDIILFVNGDDNIYEWSGGITTFASATANTITKQGTSAWGEEGFYTTRDKKVKIGGTEYTYTGGEDTTTLTGVTPDPTVAGHTAGDVVVQSVVTNADSPGSDSTVFSNDIISILNNQLWVASEINRLVYVSADDDFTDFTFSSPRTPGEGAILNLDGTPTAMAVQEDAMYISAGNSQWYQSLFTLSADNTAESLSIKRLKTTGQGSANNRNAISKIKNDVVFISKEPTIDFLGRVEDVDTPQSKPISDPIKPDLDGYDISNAHIKYFRNNIYIALPSESLVLIYNIEKGFWEAPQVLPIRRLEVFGGELYGHSNSTAASYKLFTGTSDNGNAIDSKAVFSYENFGDRGNEKSVSEAYIEGYISTIPNLPL